MNMVHRSPRSSKPEHAANQAADRGSRAAPQAERVRRSGRLDHAAEFATVDDAGNLIWPLQRSFDRWNAAPSQVLSSRLPFRRTASPVSAASALTSARSRAVSPRYEKLKMT